MLFRSFEDVVRAATDHADATGRRVTYEIVMIAGIKYMYFASKGFEASRLERDYRVYIQTSIGRDGGGATLNMTRSRFPIFISPASVQDGNFPGSGNP